MATFQAIIKARKASTLETTSASARKLILKRGREVVFRSNSGTCPGIKKFVRPVPEYFPCPNCGGQVEIWSDEDIGICETCNKESSRPEKEQSCLDWCEYADQCREIIKRMKR